MTKEYNYLESRLDSIAKTFNDLVPTDPLEQANDNIQNIIKSYILLCHAEFEKYFEDIAWSVIKNAKENYDKNKQANLPLLHLVLMMKKEFKNNEAAEDRLNKLFSNYRALIEGNHGIRKANINGLYAPIGIPISILSDTYLDLLEIFAKKRGKIAHNVKESLLTTYNYKQEKEQIDTLLSETLQEIDKKAEVLLCTKLTI